ncbi:MAG: hypothetical protein APF84_01210 [Gracilibacter sp. BRH_c7a]|nr:MAG: hypothetical protein APF84_01210 [Gracilibacter sp. BRH_c7a]
MVFRGIVLKLWLAIILLLIFILIALGLGLFQVVENFYYSQITTNLVSQGQEIIRLYLYDKDNFLINNQIEDLSRILNVHFLIANENGVIQVCDELTHMAPGDIINESELVNILNGNIIAKRGFHHHFDTQMLTIGFPVQVNDQINEVLLLYTPVAPFSEQFNSLKQLIYWSLLGSIVLASIMAFFLSRSLSKPLIKMNKVALGLANGDFSQRVTVKSNDEIGVLGASLNYLSEELKKSITDLSYEKEKIERILSGMSDGVISFNKLGRIIHYNPRAKELLDNCPDIQENNIIQDCKHLTQLSNLYDTILLTKEPMQSNLTVGRRLLVVKLSPLEDQDTGDLTGVIAVLYDITKEHRLEEMRKEFVANVSHELRTPISLIQGYAEALNDEMADSVEQQREFIKTISDESKHLNRMVEDLLELSRLQAEVTSIIKETVDINELVSNIKHKFKKELVEHSTEFIIEVDSQAKTVWADSFRLEQIIINLLSNSLRYSQGGLVNLNTRAVQNGVEIIFSDNGQGISEDDLPFIFERFYRIEKSRNREKGGTGLGLSIVKNLVEAHGGTINAQSKHGQGVSFIMYFPQTSAPDNNC